MVQLFTIKSDDLSLIHRTYMQKERTDSCNISSFLYTYAMTNLKKFGGTNLPEEEFPIKIAGVDGHPHVKNKA